MIRHPYDMYQKNCIAAITNCALREILGTCYIEGSDYDMATLRIYQHKITCLPMSM